MRAAVRLARELFEQETVIRLVIAVPPAKARREDTGRAVERVDTDAAVVGQRAAAGLSSFNTMVGILSVVIIGVLLAVSVFLISNTINVAAAFRKSENEIMRYIGATNYMIRAPFVVEGMVIGLLGAIIPLSFMSYIYQQCIGFVAEKFQILSGIFQFLPLHQIFPYMAGAAMLLGLGIGFFASFFTIRKHLKV